MQALTLESLQGNREVIIALAHKHGASNVRVFGSVARGDATSESDIDFLVDFSDNYRLLDHIGLMVELSELLSCRVDVVRFSHMREELKPYILRDVIEL